MRVVAVLVLCVVLSGCASVLGSHQKDFDFNSNPAGASVVVNGSPAGTTPLRMKLSNHKEHVIVFRKDGYNDATCTLVKGTGAGWVIFEVITGLVPVIVDAATNNWSQTKGSGCMQQMQPVSGRP